MGEMMLQYKTWCCALAIVSALGLAASPALAQQAQRPAVTYGPLYGGLELGAIIPGDIGELFSGGATGDGDLTFKTGVAAGAFLGYHVNNWLAAEASLDYAQYDMDKLTGSFSGFGSGPFNLDGDVTAWLGFANAIVTPLGRSGFSPYLGGGLGFASYESTLNAVDGVAVGAKSSETDFAADAIVGFDYAVNDSIALGARYRFVWIGSGNTTTGSGITEHEDDATAQVISATATFRF
jgi:opacity protein-like surface antigen